LSKIKQEINQEGQMNLVAKARGSDELGHNGRLIISFL